MLARASTMGSVASISDRVGDLGEYLREQREHARLSLRQLAQLAGVSNPYLSQVERGLRNPSAEVLQQIARGLRISAEALYVRAGILEFDQRRPEVEAAVHADPDLSDRQKRVLLDIYSAFRAENSRMSGESEATKTAARRRAATGSAAAEGGADAATEGGADADRGTRAPRGRRSPPAGRARQPGAGEPEGTATEAVGGRAASRARRPRGAVAAAASGSRPRRRRTGGAGTADPDGGAITPITPPTTSSSNE
jgi:transcriptional regulator with XRE-family HTH domain